MGRFFQNFPKFGPKLAEIYENFGKIRWFCSKFGTKLLRLVYEWVTFSWKICICIWVFSILWWHIPTKTKFENPPVCDFQTELLNLMLIHLKITLPLWNAYSNPSTGGVGVSSEVAYYSPGYHMYTTRISHAHLMGIRCTPHGYHMHTSWVSHAYLLSIWKSHSPCGMFGVTLPQGVCGFQVE